MDPQSGWARALVQIFMVIHGGSWAGALRIVVVLVVGVLVWRLPELLMIIVSGRALGE